MDIFARLLKCNTWSTYSFQDIWAVVYHTMENCKLPNMILSYSTEYISFELHCHIVCYTNPVVHLFMTYYNSCGINGVVKAGCSSLYKLLQIIHDSQLRIYLGHGPYDNFYISARGEHYSSTFLTPAKQV